jgi:protein PET117
MEEKALKKKLLANKLEHDHQQELRKQYEAMQPLSGVTVTAEPKKD